MELQLLNLIHKLSCPFLNHFFVAVTSLGNAGKVWIILGIVLLLQKKYRTIGIGMLLSLLLTSFFGEQIIKPLIARNRPFTYNPEISILIHKPSSFSFPSGHTGSSFACGVFLFLCNKKLGIPALILASFIAFSRMYLYVHFPTDILGGILLGSAVSFVLYFSIFKEKLTEL
ncbi:MAG: phosphatase PAP2 family protein [Anaerostipes sp.]|nr:phosphatase PAP2 family protein [Anaerostipes sp.]